MRRTKTTSDYTNFLFNQFVLEHYKARPKEVHLIFDNPTTRKFDPKQFLNMQDAMTQIRNVALTVYLHQIPTFP